MQDFLDETKIRRNFKNAQFGSRAQDLVSLEKGNLSGWVFGARKPSIASKYFLRVYNFLGYPILIVETSRSIRTNTILSEIAAEESWQIVSTQQLTWPKESSFLKMIASPINDSVAWGTLESRTESMGGYYFRDLAERRMAALVIAIRLYAIDHGMRPSELEALVPDYLAELPLDPFSSKPSTFQYRPHSSPPLLYSIFANGTDDGGVRRGPNDGPNGQLDLLFHIEPE